MRIQPIHRHDQQPQAEPCELCETHLLAGQASAWDDDLLGFLCAPCTILMVITERELLRVEENTGIRALTATEAYELISK